MTMKNRIEGRKEVIEIKKTTPITLCTRFHSL